jgi:DNA-binding GntR family transcriptional regulator
MQEISAGQYPPGSLLPSEADLARQTGLARGTVRMALATLEKEGLVDRRRGSGTRVLGEAQAAGFGQTVSGIDELIQYARDTRRIVQSVDPVVLDRDLARLLGVEAGSKWVRITNARVDPVRASRPVCAGETYLRAELSAATTLLGEETVALCDLVARVTGVRTAEIDQELQAVTIPADLADRLDAPAGSPALRILRRYHDSAGWIFEVSLSVHPADRFSYKMRLRRPG